MIKITLNPNTDKVDFENIEHRHVNYPIAKDDWASCFTVS